MKNTNRSEGHVDPFAQDCLLIRICDPGITRDKAVPIPGSEKQVTNIAHVKGLSSMLVLAIQHQFAAHGSSFNVVLDRIITFDGLGKLCTRVAGKEANIVHHDPKSFNIDTKYLAVLSIQRLIEALEKVLYSEKHFPSAVTVSMCRTTVKPLRYTLPLPAGLRDLHRE
ncbi:hypothetical protein KI387_023758, partial [Taxus chinensis]